MSSRRGLEVALGPAVALVAGCVYLGSAPAWVLGGDNGEFVTLMARGGVAHPPGYPLYVMLLRAVSWPLSRIFGNAAHASSIATAALGGLAVLTIHHASKVWGASAYAAAIATAAFASSSLMWRLSTEADVFALNVLIAALFVIAAAPRGPARGWRRAACLGLFAGLGASNHHSIVLLLPLGAWAFVQSLREERLRWRCAAVVLFFAVGLAPYLYLYASATHADPATSWVWGNIHDARTLLDHARRAEFGTTRLALRDAPREPWLQLRTFASRLTVDLLGLPLLLLVVAASSVRRLRAPVVALATAFVLSGPAFVAILNIAPRGVAATIVERFYLLPSALATILAALALDRVTRGAFDKPGRWRIAAPLVGAVLSAGFALGAASVAEGHRPTVEGYVKNTLRAAPRNAILLGSGDHKLAGFLYANRVLGLRGDVDFIAPEMLFGPWYLERTRQTLGIALSPPTADRLTLVTELLATGRPVAFAGAVPRAVTDAGFVTYPVGTLQIVEPPAARVPSAYKLETVNLRLLQAFELEPVASKSSASWAGTTFGEYARTWLLLEAMFHGRDETRAAECHARALAFAPWLQDQD